MRIAVLICTCHAHWTKRVALRSTWLKKLTADMPYFFYVGWDAGRVAEVDMAVVDAPDGLHDLPTKTQRAIARACATLEFDWLIRLDDDTFLAPERLPGLIAAANSEYIGGDCCQQHGYATGGAGVILSRRLAELIASQPTPRPPFLDQDDGWIGAVVRAAGHRLWWSPRLSHHYRLRPGPQNDMVTGHYVSPTEMRTLYASLYENAHDDRHP